VSWCLVTPLQVSTVLLAPVTHVIVIKQNLFSHLVRFVVPTFCSKGERLYMLNAFDESWHTHIRVRFFCVIENK